MRWVPPTTSSCSTSMRPASGRWPVSVVRASPSTSPCRCATCRTSPRWPPGWPHPFDRATWWSPWVPVTSPCSAGDHRGAQRRGGRSRAVGVSRPTENPESPSAAAEADVEDLVVVDARSQPRGGLTTPSQRVPTPGPPKPPRAAADRRAHAGERAGNAPSAARAQQQATAIETKPDARPSAGRAVSRPTSSPAGPRRTVKGLRLLVWLIIPHRGQRRPWGWCCVLHPGDVGPLDRGRRHRRGHPPSGSSTPHRSARDPAAADQHTDAVQPTGWPGSGRWPAHASARVPVNPADHHRRAEFRW